MPEMEVWNQDKNLVAHCWHFPDISKETQIPLTEKTCKNVVQKQIRYQVLRCQLSLHLSIHRVGWQIWQAVRPTHLVCTSASSQKCESFLS